MKEPVIFYYDFQLNSFPKEKEKKEKEGGQGKYVKGRLQRKFHPEVFLNGCESKPLYFAYACTFDFKTRVARNKCNTCLLILSLIPSNHSLTPSPFHIIHAQFTKRNFSRSKKNLLPLLLFSCNRIFLPRKSLFFLS